MTRRQVTQVLVGRFTVGLASGACTVLVPLYNEEIAEDSIRGKLGVYFDFILNIGILFMYVLGAFLPYLWFTAICGMVPLIFYASFYGMPESPTFLVSKHLFLEAEKSLLWLRDGSILYDNGTRPEMLRLILRLREATRSDRPSLLNWHTFKAVAIVFGLMFFQQLDGLNAVIFYTVQIFEEAGSSLKPTYCSMIIGVALVLAMFVPTFTVDRLGRKPLLLLSAIGATFSLAFLSIYFYFKQNGFDVGPWRWLPLTSLVIYVAVLSMGLGSLPFFMVAELVPTAAKGKISACAISFNRSMTFLLTKLFPYLVLTIGPDRTFGILCGLCLLATLFVSVCVPETKGRSREEIERMMENRLT